MSISLLVLAAGKGSRFGMLKQMDSFGPSGESIIDYSIYDAIRAGFTKVVFVIRREFESEFKRIISNKYLNKVKVEFAYQELDNLPDRIQPIAEREKPLGTGHAVWVARNHINEAFAVINADDYYGIESFKTIADYLNGIDVKSMKYQCMIGYVLKNTLSENGSVSRGICEMDSNSNLVSITEKTQIIKQNNNPVYIDNNIVYPLTGNEIVSMNMMGFSPRVFDKFEDDFKNFMHKNQNDLKTEFYLPSVLNNLVKENISKVKVLRTNSEWFGVTYKDDKKIVSESLYNLVKKGLYPHKLWKNQ